MSARIGVLKFLAAALLVVGLCWPLVNVSGPSSPVADAGATIVGYDSDMTVSAEGTLQARTKLTVDITRPGKHGIFEFFDRWNEAQPNSTFEPTDFKVTRDGVAEPFAVSEEQHGRFVVLQIGSADRTLTQGRHEYVIEHSVEGVLAPSADAGHSELYWTVIPSGFGAVLPSATIRVHLPVDAPSEVPCAVEGAGASCEVSGGGTRELKVAVSNLPPTGVAAIKTDLPLATPTSWSAHPWPARWTPVVSESAWVLALALIAAAITGLLGLRLGRSVREPKPPFPLQYAPPEGIGPAQAQFVLTERVGREQYVASLLHAAEQGAAALDRPGDAWSVSGKGDWTGLDEVTQAVGNGLGIASGATFQARKRNKADGQVLQSALTNFSAETRRWGQNSGNVVPAGLGSLGGALVMGAGVVTIAVGYFGANAAFTMLALIPGLFAIGALDLVMPGAGTRRTPQGRDLWSRLGGFRRVLSTSPAEARFDFAARKDLYTAYIPWAVAFGVADQWAKKYRMETGQEPPVPTYFPMYSGVHTGNYVDSMVNDFNSTVNSAISTYTASQSSSSGGGGGGGGFSGGGGGGGGGFGSW